MKDARAPLQMGRLIELQDLLEQKASAWNMCGEDGEKQDCLDEAEAIRELIQLRNQYNIIPPVITFLSGQIYMEDIEDSNPMQYTCTYASEIFKNGKTLNNRQQGWLRLLPTERVVRFTWCGGTKEIPKQVPQVRMRTVEVPGCQQELAVECVEIGDTILWACNTHNLWLNKLLPKYLTTDELTAISHSFGGPVED